MDSLTLPDNHAKAIVIHKVIIHVINIWSKLHKAVIHLEWKIRWLDNSAISLHKEHYMTGGIAEWLGKEVYSVSDASDWFSIQKNS